MLSHSACPTARKGKGLFSLGDINAIWRLQSPGVQIVLREGHRMSKQEGVTVVSDTVGRLVCSIIQHNSLSLRFNLPSVERGVWSLFSPMRREAEGLRRLGWWHQQMSLQLVHLFKCGHRLLQGRSASPLPSVCLQICCPFREGRNKSRLEEM